MVAPLVRTAFFTAALTMAACGGSGETPSTGSPAAAVPARTPVPETAPEPAPSAADLRSMREAAAGDLDAIAARGYLRVLVTPSRTHYAIADGLQRGAAVDAALAFETFLNGRRAPGQPAIEVVLVPTPENALAGDLADGRGDIAANLLFTFERYDQVAFAEPARSGIRELVVTGPGVTPMVSLEDVAGRTIHARKSSDHYASLVRLNEQLAGIDKPGCTIVVADESLTDEDLLAQVNDGVIPATLVNDYVFDAWRDVFTAVSVNREIAVSQDGVHAWAVRKDAPELLAALSAFMTTHDLAVRAKAR